MTSTTAALLISYAHFRNALAMLKADAAEMSDREAKADVLAFLHDIEDALHYQVTCAYCSDDKNLGTERRAAGNMCEDCQTQWGTCDGCKGETPIAELRGVETKLQMLMLCDSCAERE